MSPFRIALIYVMAASLGACAGTKIAELHLIGLEFPSVASPVGEEEE